MNLSYRKTELARIDFTDYSYSISPITNDLTDDELNESIRNYGILHPPIIRETAPDRYIIVSGRKRLTIFQNLCSGENTCTCLVVTRHTPELEVFEILLEEKLLDSELSLAEKGALLKKASSRLDKTQVTERILPRIGLEPTSSSIDKHTAILDLEKHIIDAIHHGRINDKVAWNFLDLSPEDRQALFRVISVLRLSTGYQKKLVAMCSELAGRQGAGISSLLEDEQVNEILNHQTANTPQKTKKLMELLTRRATPRYTKAEENFMNFINALQLPPNVTVSHTPFFEDNAITLSVTVRDSKSAESVWSTLKDVIYASNDNH